MPVQCYFCKTGEGRFGWVRLAIGVLYDYLNREVKGN